MAEALNSLFKAELIRGPAYRRPGGWRGIDDLEFAIMDWVGWYNNDRLHSELGHVPPVEHEAAYWATQAPGPAVGEEQHHDEPGEQPDTSTRDATTASHAQTTTVLAMAGSN